VIPDVLHYKIKKTARSRVFPKSLFCERVAQRGSWGPRAHQSGNSLKSGINLQESANKKVCLCGEGHRGKPGGSRGGKAGGRKQKLKRSPHILRFLVKVGEIRLEVREQGGIEQMGKEYVSIIGYNTAMNRGASLGWLGGERKTKVNYLSASAILFN